MNKTYIILMALPLMFFSGMARSQTVKDALAEIEKNNIAIRAANSTKEAKLIEARLGNRLPDPTVSYKKAFEKSPSTGREQEIKVTQGFDFPSIYFQRRNVNNTQREYLRAEYDEIRQQTLLEAQMLCLDLILIEKENTMLNMKMKNAAKIMELYRLKMQEGSATTIELNKAELEYLNAESELLVNSTQKEQTLRSLITLNGGMALTAAPTEYDNAEILPPLSELSEEAISSDATSVKSTLQETVAKKELRLEKHRMLPSFDISYIREKSFETTSNAFEIGMSIPLWEKAGNVKRAKAASLVNTLEREDTHNKIVNDLAANYNDAIRLKEAMQRFSPDMFEESLNTLEKAFEHREISLIDFFNECNNIYQSMQTYYRLENSYHKSVANLLKHRI